MEVFVGQPRAEVATPNEDEWLRAEKQMIRLQNFKKHLGGIKQRLRQVTSGNIPGNLGKSSTSDKENIKSDSIEVANLNVLQLPSYTVEGYRDKQPPIMKPQILGLNSNFNHNLSNHGNSPSIQNGGHNQLEDSKRAIMEVPKLSSLKESSLQASGSRITTELLKPAELVLISEQGFSFRNHLPDPALAESIHQFITSPPKPELHQSSPHQGQNVASFSPGYHRPETLFAKGSFQSRNQIPSKSAIELPYSSNGHLAVILEERGTQKPSSKPNLLKFSPPKAHLPPAGSSARLGVTKVSSNWHSSSPNFESLESRRDHTSQSVSLSDAYLKSRGGIVKSMLRPRSNAPELFAHELLAAEAQTSSSSRRVKKLMNECAKFGGILSDPKYTKQSGKRSGSRSYQQQDSLNRSKDNSGTKLSLRQSSVDHNRSSLASSAMITPSFQRNVQKSVEELPSEQPQVNRQLFLRNDSLEDKLRSLKGNSRDRRANDSLSRQGTARNAAKPTHKTGLFDRSKRNGELKLMKQRLNSSCADSQQNTSCKLNQSSINTSRLEAKLSTSKDKAVPNSSAIIQRLVRGARAEVSPQEMRSRSKRRYEELPEVKARRLQTEARDTSFQRVTRIKAYDSTVRGAFLKERTPSVDKASARNNSQAAAGMKNQSSSRSPGSRRTKF